ncbi:hypothetical protein [Streptomyces sp. DHE17-7]|uniref:hypothetical protein n=1 Tax=Streptomyces sp. DHE17-7 TaxID=2759949 RepID=UPI0022EA96D5|nr:hypothetical protein [Streptomyces sp. DHE17-7]MBJ6623196.1 hypothetical protein [Streptomyces sp. DHE17-7]
MTAARENWKAAEARQTVRSEVSPATKRTPSPMRRRTREVRRGAPGKLVRRVA